MTAGFMHSSAANERREILLWLPETVPGGTFVWEDICRERMLRWLSGNLKCYAFSPPYTYMCVCVCVCSVEEALLNVGFTEERLVNGEEEQDRHCNKVDPLALGFQGTLSLNMEALFGYLGFIAREGFCSCMNLPSFKVNQTSSPPYMILGGLLEVERFHAGSFLRALIEV